MKKVLLCLLGVLCLLGITGCNNKLESTNLSNIYLDNMTIGTKISSEDLSNYTNTDRYSGNYKYKFEEIIVDTNDDNEINYLFARFDENYIDIKINKTQVKTTDDLKEVLGNNYQDKNYDKEQQLKEYIYKDNEKNIKAEFIYSSNDNILKWIILSK